MSLTHASGLWAHTTPGNASSFRKFKARACAKRFGPSARSYDIRKLNTRVCYGAEAGVHVRLLSQGIEWSGQHGKQWTSQRLRLSNYATLGHELTARAVGRELVSQHEGD